MLRTKLSPASGQQWLLEKEATRKPPGSLPLQRLTTRGSTGNRKNPNRTVAQRYVDTVTKSAGISLVMPYETGLLASAKSPPLIAKRYLIGVDTRTTEHGI